MSKPQNIYDNQTFFSEYQKMRETHLNANELLEIPTIKKMLPNVKGMAVLDLGCGAGGMARFFADNGAKQVVAIDVSENMINTAKSETTQQNITYIKMPMEDLNTLNQKFDLVFSSLAFHYVEDFEKLVSNISKLLAPNGILLFSQEHPTVTASIPCNKEMKKYLMIEGKRYYLLSDYNNIGKRSLNWNVEGVTKYHRNFSTIINSIINSGMNILQIQESQALKNAVKQVEKYKYQVDRSYFLFVKAQKM